ncbi:hypothetical protein GCM10009839_33850 [Catenulispora yoronensis]|uniref:Uncharacterized protein n=1 Tax=Catenulispora yoronensis TaxID=450799 RepID=A0ABP5FSI7_9ACTN
MNLITDPTVLAAARKVPRLASNGSRRAAPVKEMSHSAMHAAFSAGEATSLTSAITDIARYDSSWWLYDRDSWLRVTDAELVAVLENFAARTTRESATGNLLTGIQAAAADGE